MKNRVLYDILGAFVSHASDKHYLLMFIAKKNKKVTALWHARCVLLTLQDVLSLGAPTCNLGWKISQRSSETGKKMKKVFITYWFSPSENEKSCALWHPGGFCLSCLWQAPRTHPYRHASLTHAIMVALSHQKLLEVFQTCGSCRPLELP